MLDVQAKQVASDQRLEKIEQSFSQLVNCIDELVVLLRNHYYRLAKRISFLEQKLAITTTA